MDHKINFCNEFSQIIESPNDYFEQNNYYNFLNQFSNPIIKHDLLHSNFLRELLEEMLNTTNYSFKLIILHLFIRISKIDSDYFMELINSNFLQHINLIWDSFRIESIELLKLSIKYIPNEEIMPLCYQLFQPNNLKLYKSKNNIKTLNSTIKIMIKLYLQLESIPFYHLCEENMLIILSYKNDPHCTLILLQNIVLYSKRMSQIQAERITNILTLFFTEEMCIEHPPFVEMIFLYFLFICQHFSPSDDFIVTINNIISSDDFSFFDLYHFKLKTFVLDLLRNKQFLNKDEIKKLEKAVNENLEEDENENLVEIENRDE